MFIIILWYRILPIKIEDNETNVLTANKADQLLSNMVNDIHVPNISFNSDFDKKILDKPQQEDKNFAPTSLNCSTCSIYGKGHNSNENHIFNKVQ